MGIKNSPKNAIFCRDSMIFRVYRVFLIGKNFAEFFKERNDVLTYDTYSLRIGFSESKPNPREFF